MKFTSFRMEDAGTENRPICRLGRGELLEKEETTDMIRGSLGTLHTPRLLIWTPLCPCRAARTLYMIHAQMKRPDAIFVKRKAPWRGNYTHFSPAIDSDAARNLGGYFTGRARRLSFCVPNYNRICAILNFIRIQKSRYCSMNELWDA